MKFVPIAVSHIVFVLAVSSAVLYQNWNNSFPQLEKFYSIKESVVAREIKEPRLTDDKLLALFQEDNATKSFITEGSSTTDGYRVTNEYPRQLAVLLGGNYYKHNVNLILDSSNLWTVRNVGNGRDTMTEITAQYGVQVYPHYNPALSVNYLTLQGGSNDIANGRTTEALKADVTAYVARAKSDGFRVGVCTVFHRVGNDPAKVSDYNDWLRRGSSGADFIIDLAAHPILSDATNLTYFQDDGIHTNNAGQTVITEVFAASLLSVAPTTLSTTINGRVLTANNRGISNVALTLTDAAGNTRTVSTTSFGYFRFRGVALGQTYQIAVKAKRFSFTQPSQRVNTNEDAVQVNFIANP